MYDGNNPAALTSQRAIAAAMLELMRSEPYENISVSAVCRLAGVSRQTFYSLFRSQDNVMVYLLRADACDAPRGGESASDALRALCRSYSQYVISQEAVLRLLARNRRMALLRDELRESFEGCGCFTRGVEPGLRPYAADFAAAALTSITETFLRTDADPDTLEDTAWALLRGRLFEE